MIGRRKKYKDLRVLTEGEIQNKLYGKHAQPKVDENMAAQRETVETLEKEKQDESLRRMAVEEELERAQGELNRTKKVLTKLSKEKSSLEKKLYKALTQGEKDTAAASFEQGPAAVRVPRTIFDLSPRLRLVVSVVALIVVVFTSVWLISKGKGRGASQPAAVSFKEPSQTKRPEKVKVKVKEVLPAPQPKFLSKPYTIQICVYKKKRDAGKIVEDLGRKGYPAWIVTRTSARGRTYYNIYVGRFATGEKALQYWDTVKEEEDFEDFEDSFVRRY